GGEPAAGPGAAGQSAAEPAAAGPGGADGSRPGSAQSWPAGRGWEALTRHDPGPAWYDPELGPSSRTSRPGSAPASGPGSASSPDLPGRPGPDGGSGPDGGPGVAADAGAVGAAGTGPGPESPGRDDWPGRRAEQAGWRSLPTWLGLGALAALLAVVGGPLVLAVPLAVVLAYYLPRWCGWVACAAMIAAGLLTALTAHPAQPGTGAFGGPAQACALLALAVALVPALPARRSLR
ncbi:MAG: hypothetical protein ACR2FU_19295, partial [Streptosporangiaceae bacterium]